MATVVEAPSLKKKLMVKRTVLVAIHRDVHKQYLLYTFLLARYFWKPNELTELCREKKTLANNNLELSKN